MQSITYHVATSVDGYIAGRDGALDAFLMEGDHVADYLEELRGYGTVVMGRKTYEVGRAHGVEDPYPFLKTIVFSRTITSDHPNIRVVSGDAVETLRALKAAEGPGIYLCGGGELAAQAAKAGLLDALAVKVNPHVAGGGVPMFGGELSTIAMTFLSSKAYGSGVVLNRYRVC